MDTIHYNQFYYNK